METLKYTVIKNKKQYNDYCRQLDTLLCVATKSKAINSEIELLTLLIKTWDNEHNTFDELDPVELLKSMMDEYQIRPAKLAQQLAVSRGLISDILAYKKGMSKEMIRKLAGLFSLSQEAFNRPYDLKVPLTDKAPRRSRSVVRKTVAA